MRRPFRIRTTAAVFAGALALGVPATANAQSLGELDPASLGTFAGGALASVGLPDLGSAAPGGECAALDPGSVMSTLSVDVSSKEGAPGVAQVALGGAGWFSQTTGTFHWENTTTGASGAEEFGPWGGDAAPPRFDIETGAGEVAWSVDAEISGTPFSVGVPLIVIGSMPMPDAASSAPYSTCTGTATIA